MHALQNHLHERSQEVAILANSALTSSSRTLSLRPATVCILR
jgi:hypothetical protein